MPNGHFDAFLKQIFNIQLFLGFSLFQNKRPGFFSHSGHIGELFNRMDFII